MTDTLEVRVAVVWHVIISDCVHALDVDILRKKSVDTMMHFWKSSYQNKRNWTAALDQQLFQGARSLNHSLVEIQRIQEIVELSARKPCAVRLDSSSTREGQKSHVRSPPPWQEVNKFRFHKVGNRGFRGGAENFAKLQLV